MKSGTLLSKFLRCERAGVIIEFAVVAPVLFYLLLAIIEFGLITFSMIVIESATNSTARYIRTGYNPGAADGMSLEEFVRSDIKARTFGLINHERIFITTDLEDNYEDIAPDACLDNPSDPHPASCFGPYTELNGLPGYQGGTPALDPGAAGDIVRLQTLYRWTPLTGYQYLYNEVAEDMVIRSITFIKNEPA
jgi:hypothetical protein